MRSVVLLLPLLLSACATQNVASDEVAKFLKQPVASRVERVRQYPLEEQYEIFRYGNDVIHPPDMELANPIAERGASAIPFLLNKLTQDVDDVTVRDIMLIFLAMGWTRSYDVKSDNVVMIALSASVDRIQGQPWHDTCVDTLRRIKE